MGLNLKYKLRNIFKRLSGAERTILRHENTLAEHLYIGIEKEAIIDRLNAFDWLDLCNAETDEQLAVIVMRFFEGFNFRYPKAFESIVLKAFTHKFFEAVQIVKEEIERTHKSYNVDGAGQLFRNDLVDKFYYINYWATKKSIPVNYNEKRQDRRELFNMDTIIFSILADKLQVLNDYERNKPKPR